MALSVTSAQVQAWLAVHKGALSKASQAADGTTADAAVARMMLHRRRAVVWHVVSEFLDRLRSGSVASYLENRAAQMPESAASELELSQAAGEEAARIGGEAPPLLLERALLAEMQGGYSSALADLDELLDAFPGSLAAAVAFARIALQVGDSERAIGALAYVENELVCTREGSGLLADALHAIGMHQPASHYDVAALVATGEVDRQGNDCTAVDMNGDAAIDTRMPPAFLLDNEATNQLLCNDRGVYYTADSLIGESLTGLMGTKYIALSAVRPTAGRDPIGRLRLFCMERNWPFPAGLAIRDRAGFDSAAAKGSGLRRFLRKYNAVAGRLMSQTFAHPKIRGPIRRSYSRVPEPMRYRLNEYVLKPLRRRLIGKWREVVERDRRSEIVRERLQQGVARIFQLRSAPGAGALSPQAAKILGHLQQQVLSPAPDRA
jgi:hypothetical protein